MGEFKKPFSELKKGFLQKVSSKKKQRAFYGKFRPERFKRDLET
jgi:hypothetical protein